MSVPIGPPSPQVSPDQAIAELAAGRHGVFTREMAVSSGFRVGQIRKRLETGRWERLFPGVYRLAGAPPTWRQGLVAAVDAAGPPACTSHLACARMWGYPHGEELVEILVPRGRRFRLPGVMIHETTDLPPVDRAIKDGIRLTSPPRNIVDLAAILKKGQLEEVVDAALTAGLRLSRILWRFRELSKQGRPGLQVLGDILAARTPGAKVPASVLESRLRVVIEGLPQPAWGLRVVIPGLNGATHRDRYLDAPWPGIMLVVEIDGWEHHSGRQQFQADIERQNSLILGGWGVLRYSAKDLAERPDEVRAEIALAIESLTPGPRLSRGPAGDVGGDSTLDPPG